MLGNIINGIINGFLPQSNGSDARVPAAILKKSDIGGSIKAPSPQETMKGDPLGFSSINYPLELTTEELGHYIIFYSLTNNYGHVGRDFELASAMGWSDQSFVGGTHKVTDETVVAGMPEHNERESSVQRGSRYIINNQLRHGKTPPVQVTNHSVMSKVPDKQTVTSAISLYMPPGINVSYKNGYEIEAAELAGDIMRTGDKMVLAATRTKAFEAFLKGFVGSAGTYFKQISSGALDTVGGGDLFRLSTKNIGLAVNPRNEQYYIGPGFRSFTYTFDFYPKSKEEAENVQKIITLFKYHSSPAMETEKTHGRFFIVPSEFEIHYMFRDGPNPHLHKISRCVCTDVDVKYGPEAQWSTFEDGHPTQTQVTLGFTELEFMTKDKVADVVSEGPAGKYKRHTGGM